MFGFFIIPYKGVGDPAFTVGAPTSESSGAFTFASSNSAVATTTSEGIVTIVGAGTRTNTASGTNTNGVYTIQLDKGEGLVSTEVYCLMDSAVDGGGWTLAMKAPRNSTTFHYSSNYWTTANTLNPRSTSNATAGATNAKFDTFNFMSVTDMLALFSGSVNQYVSLPSAFTGWNGSVFSAQEGFQWYGFNYSGYAGLKVRWGFGWNNEFDEGSNDVTGGIGLSYGNWSAGDRVNCCQTTDGLNRSMAFEMFVR